jgi:RNA polymerase sigma-70 factor, ECF subfamily
MGMTEAEAIQLCRSGNPMGLKTLYELHREKVYRLSWRMLGAPHDAEDAVQEVFLKVFRTAEQWRGDSAFSTWLYRMTSNHCLDVLRRKKVVNFASLDAEDAEGRKFEPADPKDKTGRGGKALCPLVARSLEILPAAQRACLLMREMEDLSYEEIAGALKMNLGTVKSNIHRAKTALKAALEKAGLSPEDYR